MANPSLQIGNDNWAIKEDNLLGYSTAGTRFLPQPITMTRASAGTRVNSQGLVETVELLGGELVTNGDFENNVIGWNKFKSNATESWNAGGYLDFTKTGVSGRLGSDVLIETNKTYKISVNVISLGGILDLYVGLSDFESPYAGVSSTPLVVGTNTFYLTFAGSASSKGVYLQSAGSNYFGLTASIDSISVKESTKNNLARVDYDGTASSLLVEPQRRNLVTYSEAISNLPLLTGGAGTYTITDNYTNSPEGVQNASRVQMSIVDTNDGANYSLIALNSSMTNGVTREISFYAKSLTGLNQEVLVYWSTAKQIVTLTNDWQRFEISGTSAQSGAVLIGTRGGTTQYYAGGDANLDFAIWGLQVEDDGSGGGSSYATSYIPTDGGTVTRVQETYTKTGISNLINSEEGVLFLEAATLVDPTSVMIIGLSDVTAANRISITFHSTLNRIQIFAQKNNSQLFNIDNTSVSKTNFNKIAISYSSTSAKFFLNGTLVASAIPTDMFTANTLDRLNFDIGSGSNPFYGKVKQLQVFKTTDIDLAALTS